jgi:hypothetical protein
MPDVTHDVKADPITGETEDIKMPCRGLEKWRTTRTDYLR